MNTRLASSLRENGPGFAGSLLLHGLLALLMLVLAVRHPAAPWPRSEAHFVPVDLILGQDTALPAGPAGPPTLAAPQIPKQDAASPTDAAIGPRGQKAPEDALDAKLKALARLKQPNRDLSLDNDTGADERSMGGGSGGLSYGVRDYIRAQILRRWYFDFSRIGARKLTIRLALTMTRSGDFTEVRIIGPMPENDVLYRDVALSARNAATLSSPILLPPGDYPKVMHFTLPLDPRDVRD